MIWDFELYKRFAKNSAKHAEMESATKMLQRWFGAEAMEGVHEIDPMEVDIEQCPQCLEELYDGISGIKKLPCGHRYHEDCLWDMYVQRKITLKDENDPYVKCLACNKVVDDRWYKIHYPSKIRELDFSEKSKSEVKNLDSNARLGRILEEHKSFLRMGQERLQRIQQEYSHYRRLAQESKQNYEGTKERIRQNVSDKRVQAMRQKAIVLSDLSRKMIDMGYGREIKDYPHVLEDVVRDTHEELTPLLMGIGRGAMIP